MDNSIGNKLVQRGVKMKTNILLPIPYWIASLLTGLVAGRVMVLVSSLIDRKLLHDLSKEEIKVETPVEKINTSS